MDQTIIQAYRLGMIPDKPEGAADATGLSADGRSSYYAQRLKRSKGRRKHGKTKRYKLPKWPKLNAIIHTQSHLILAAVVNEGPSHDSPELPELLRQTSRRLRLDRLLADSGYDSEEHHRLGREEHHIRSTVIALNPRNHGRRWPKTKYRRQMKRRFPKRKFGQRWQVESVWSRHKRRLGWVLASKSVPAQVVEIQNRVVTHNLMLLALH
jgi:hypothetical protein